MKVNVVQYSKDLNQTQFFGKTVVVIDVFRATTVMVTALAHGVKKIYPFANIEEAKAQYTSMEPESAVLVGERQMQKIPGFDLGNTPRAFMRDEYAGKSMVMTTTNGTNAIHCARFAENIVIASLVNCKAVAEYLVELGKDVIIICSGLSSSFSLEDAYCAGMIISVLKENIGIEQNDLARIASFYYEKNRSPSVLRNSKAYQNLQLTGYEEDAEFCLNKNIFSAVPQMDKQTCVIA